MRSPYCLYCNELVVRHRGWKHDATRRLGGWVHDKCIGDLKKHREIVSEIRRKLRLKHRKNKYGWKRKIYNHQYHITHRKQIYEKNKRWNDCNRDKVKAYHLKRYKYVYPRETDNIFLIRIAPKIGNTWNQ